MIAAAALLAIADARAGEPPPTPAPPESPQHQDAPQPHRDWELHALLYVWASAIDADVSAHGVSTKVSASFTDLLQHLGWAFEGGAELRYRHALLLVDGIGNQISNAASSGRRTVPFQLLPGGPGGELTVGPFDVKARTTMWIVDVKAGWRALSLPVSKLVGAEVPEDPRRFDVDLFAGFRYWNVASKLRVHVDPATLTIGGMPVDLGSLGGHLPGVDVGPIGLPGRVLRGGSETAEETTSWVDPIVGFRLRGDVTKEVSLFTLVDLGGFGIGDASQFTWHAVAGLNWRFAEHWSVVLAYRGLGVNPSDPVDRAILHGPLVGLGLRF